MENNNCNSQKNCCVCPDSGSPTCTEYNAVKTYPALRKLVFKTLGSGCVTHHESTEENKLGQSGVHTFIDDIIDIVLNSASERDAYKNLWKYLSVDK